MAQNQSHSQNSYMVIEMIYAYIPSNLHFLVVPFNTILFVHVEIILAKSRVYYLLYLAVNMKTYDQLLSHSYSYIYIYKWLCGPNF